MSKRKTPTKRVRKSRQPKSRGEQLVDFLQDVALGKRQATASEVTKAQEELDKLLPDLPDA